MTQADPTRAGALERTRRVPPSLLDDLEAIVWEMDSATWQFTFVSAGAERILGYSVAQWLEPDFWVSHIHPDDRERAVAYCRDCITRASNHELEYRMVAADGRAVWLRDLVHVVPGAPGAPPVLHGVMVEITAHKNLEVRLRASEERYRALVEAMPDGVAVHVDGRFVFLNAAGTRLLGAQSATELIGRPVLDFVHPDSMAKAESQLRALAAEGQAVRGSRYTLRRLDGSAVEVELSATALEFNGLAAVQVVCRDISERLRTEETLHVTEQRLQESQRIEAVGRLAGGIAHDFNNLMTVITAFTQMALEGVAADDARRSDLLEVRHAADRAAELTRQLLAFSRRQVMQPTPMDVNEAVRRIERMLRRIIGPGVELCTELTDREAVVSADAGQLDQVFMNLVLNARDAMPDGGTVTIRTTMQRLEAAAGRAQLGVDVEPGEYVRVDVTDTGTGMTPEVRRRLFEPFFTTKPVGQGTGLGLPVVYGIIKQSGGYIAVDSTPGRGTTFSLFLPHVPERAAAGEAAAATATMPGSGTVLLVEDEPALRLAIRRFLERAGYRVLLAEHGDAALRVARSAAEPIDLLLTDLVMPGMDGRALAQRFTAEHPGVPVLLMSGYVDDEGLLQGNTLQLLQKPFTMTELTERVREMIDAAVRGDTARGV